MRIADEAHLQVLRLLHEQPELSQRQLAEKLGVSLGKTNYVLRALLERGAIKARNFRSSQNKLAYAYLLTPKGLAEKAALTQGYLRRKIAEYDALRSEIENLERELRLKS